MKKFGKVVVKLRIPILVLSFLLLIPSVLGYFNTRVNYDILYYLPSDIDTMQGQDILLDDFGKGAYAMVVVDGMNKSNVSKLVKKVEGVDHVASVISYSGIVGDDVPSEILPDKFRSYFENEDSGATLFAIFFDDTTSSDDTMKAIQEVRDVTDNQCYIAGMSAVVTDTKTMAEKETPFYVLVAVVLVCIVLAIFMDSFLVPVFFMLSIGMAIVYNLGSNYFLGEVSYITKALAAVLQLGVTLDYSIFLWHSYKEAKEETPDDHQEAMAVAIGNTLTSVVGSSITTVAGFIALCFMSFTLGLDLGVVMAKGVVLGVIGCVTILPSLILTFDKALEKTMHREIMPNFDKPARWIVNHSWIFLIIFVLLLGPAIYGYNNTKVYYDLSDTLPEKLNCSQANKLLADNFDGTNSIYMILADSNLSAEDSNAMMNEVNDLDGISFALSIDSALGGEIPTEMLPDSLVSELKGDEYQIMMVSTNYTIASDEINDQIDKVDAIAKKYDAKSMVIGEAPCTKDLITITDKDGTNVSNDFNLSIKGQTITASAKADYMKSSDFKKADQEFMVRLTVHRIKTKDVYTFMAPWIANYPENTGYTFYVPNASTVRYRVKDAKETTQLDSEPCWVTDEIKSKLTVEKDAKYDDWKVGDEVSYSVEVTQTKQDGYATNVVVKDTDIPSSLKLVNNGWEVSGPNSGTIPSMSSTEEGNGWILTCPLLQYNESIKITFKCIATADSNGQDWINTVTAEADNFTDDDGSSITASDSAEVWVNSPVLTVDKVADRYEYEVGDTVNYTVSVKNTADYTIGQNVEVSDIDIPEGLELQGDPTIEMGGEDTSIGWPVVDGTTTIATEERDNNVEVTSDGNSWTINAKYLTSKQPLNITFSCIATKAANGVESQNVVSATADNFLSLSLIHI
mgnify:CR=1 FL=1